jgi:uncharacterized protein HemX
MNSVTYNFVHPEEFDNFIPEATRERQTRNAQTVVLVITAGIIVAGIGYIYYRWWQDQQEKESQIRRQ